MATAGSRRRWVCAGVALLLALGCRSGVNPRLSPELAGWADGPVRWLLLDEEARRFAALRDDLEARRFIEGFWARRDPEPGSAGNELREHFEMRVEVADRLYGEPSRRGSLTDRGGAYVLLGAPSELRQMRRTAPAVDPRARRGRAAAGATRSIVIEEWTYRPEDLSPRLLERLDPEAREAGLSLRFQIHEERASLLQGRAPLRKAAAALLGEVG